MEAIATILFMVFFVAVFAGSIAWGVKEFETRDAGLLWLFLLWLLGPFAIVLWFVFRPSKLVDRDSTDFDNADDQLAAATKLESLGDWDASLSLLKDAAVRWPEHEQYIQNMIAEIERKIALQCDEA